MAIISSKGVKESSLNFKQKPFGKIYQGWPEEDYIYLYHLSPENFKLASPNKHQFISKIPIERIRDEFLKIIRYYNGISLLHEHDLLKQIIPEFEST